ncbi:hypothetical protein KKF82_06320 [Patescibacteria group bacterium]|nr:hypothetical protein [Patescibacteria group bacterium]
MEGGKEMKEYIPIEMGGFNYKGIRLRHEWQAMVTISEILKEFDPELIIEFGSQYGGLTLFMNDTCPNAEIRAYDIDNRYFHDVKKQLNDNVIFKVCNILIGLPKDIVNLCRDKRRKFLYCDNGNKIHEVNTYAPFLNPGDMIGCHDWGIEIKEEDVEKVLRNFKPVKHDIFHENGWRSRFWKKI